MADGKKRGASKKVSTPVWVWAIPAVAALSFAGFRYMYSSYRTPSGSMIPTLLLGDHFFVQRGMDMPPRRGAVILFRFPENPAQDFVKRILAVPGDRLEMIGGRPVINGWLAPHCHVGTYPTENRTAELYVEYLGDAAYGTIYEGKEEWPACKADADCNGTSCRGGVCGVLQGPWDVKAGEVWMVGDNRNNSHDSRTWNNGLGRGLPLDLVRGTARTIWMGTEDGRSGTAVGGPPVLPAKAASLKAALDKCLAERPPLSATTPPGR